MAKRKRTIIKDTVVDKILHRKLKIKYHEID